MLGLAKTKMTADEFGQVSSAVPGADGRLKAAPEVDKNAGGLAGLTSKAGGLTSLAGSFNKLGLKPTDAAKFAPVMLKYLNTNGGGQAAQLLSKVWK